MLKTAYVKVLGAKPSAPSMFASPPPKCSEAPERNQTMPNHPDEFMQEDTMDRIVEEMEVLMLDALLSHFVLPVWPYAPV